jgi:hypothetical protein
MSKTTDRDVEREKLTDVRFSTRTLLFLMVLVAIVAATAGQCIRNLDSSQRTYAAAAWAGWSVILFAWVVLMGRKRYLAERSAGPTILRLPVYGMNPYWRIISRWLFSGYLLAIGPLMLITMAARSTTSGSMPAALLTALYPDAIFLAWLTAVCITLWWWKSDIRLCDAGVLWDKRFIRWSDTHESWDPDRDAITLRGADQIGAELRCEAIVSDEERPVVDELLKNKLRATATAAARGEVTGQTGLRAASESPG